MASLLDDLGNGIKAVGSEWPKYAAVGSFALYVAGYLALRFHLLALGIATDLSVLDERYVFTGARFLVYLVSALPSILLMATPLALGVWLASRLVPARLRLRFSGWVRKPHVLAALGIAMSLAAIQGLMRQCYHLQDLLLADRLPEEPALLIRLLMGTASMSDSDYFNLLVASCVLPLALLRWLFVMEGVSAAAAAGRWVLAALVAIQLLFLPINFGVLIVDKTLARVTAAGDRPTQPGETVWLVWEGKIGVTYLVCSPDGLHRSLLTLSREKVAAIEIVALDRIVPAIFSPTGERRKPPAIPPP